MNDKNDVELYLKYRPSSFDEVIGQEAAVKTLTKFLENGNLPHVLLLTGPSVLGRRRLLGFSVRNSVVLKGISMKSIVRLSIRLIRSATLTSTWICERGVNAGYFTSMKSKVSRKRFSRNKHC